MKWIPALLLLFMVACSMNAEQERSLNQAMSSYVNSYNNGAVLSYVSFTHPNVVSYYKNKGDEVFKEKFELMTEDYESSFLQDGIIRQIVSKNEKIHVHYQFLKFDNTSTMGYEIAVVALSEDDGRSWYFIDREDYINDAILDKEFRLIDFK